MKKLFCLMLVFLSLTSIAYADEIMFRDIPWGANVSEVLSSLGLVNADEVDKNSDVDKYRLVCVYESDIEEFGSQQLCEFSSFENCGYTCSPLMAFNMTVAEHKVSWLKLQFLFGITDGNVSREQSDSEFYSAKYQFSPDDYVTAYEDLLDKLIWLYGEPIVEETVDNDSYLTNHRHERYARWDGENDTSALLYVKYYTDDTNKSRHELSIEYAKTDVSEKVEFIEHYFEQEERNSKYNSDNTDGL